MASEVGTRYPAWALVADARGRAALSVQSLATLTGLAIQRITDIEAGRASPTVDELFVMVRACGFELRITAADTDGQRSLHVQAALQRDATARIQANTDGLRAYNALRNATPISEDD